MKPTTLILMSLSAAIPLTFGIYSWLNREAAPIQMDSRAAILKEIQSTAELTTARYTGDVTVTLTQDNQIWGVSTGTSTLVYTGRGEVRAGLDWSQVTLDGEVVQLPPVKLLDSKVDVTQSNVAVYNPAWFSDPKLANKLQDQAQREALKRLLVSACQSNLIQHARLNAKTKIVTKLPPKFQVVQSPPGECR
ncbi:DUF4230 domain-containing protein [Leptolyngbya sp. AN03gr2]|uniref:DUF4230 domain-containing protein n=1 Tax=Leptolyngbya sp. AN03gr2 TaxID=3423364 RepID=UPI003D31E9B3